MIEHYKKPSIKFIVNKGNFNKMLGILTFQEENIVTKDWQDKAKSLKDLLLRYSIPSKDESGEISIIDIGLYPKEASELIVLLLSALDRVQVDEDYTRKMKKARI